MGKQRACKICQNTFTPKVPWQQVCEDPECKRQYKLQRNRRWRKKNPDYHSEYMRQYRSKRKRKKLYM